MMLEDFLQNNFDDLAAIIDSAILVFLRSHLRLNNLLFRLTAGRI